MVDWSSCTEIHWWSYYWDWAKHHSGNDRWILETAYIEGDISPNMDCTDTGNTISTCHVILLILYCVPECWTVEAGDVAATISKVDGFQIVSRISLLREFNVVMLHSWEQPLSTSQYSNWKMASIWDRRANDEVDAESDSSNVLEEEMPKKIPFSLFLIHHEQARTYYPIMVHIGSHIHRIPPRDIDLLQRQISSDRPDYNKPEEPNIISPF